MFIFNFMLRRGFLKMLGPVFDPACYRSSSVTRASIDIAQEMSGRTLVVHASMIRVSGIARMSTVRGVVRSADVLL